MAFKTMNSYNDEKWGNFFRLQNDGDFADVVFMYRSTDDVMMADTHYIKSDSYSGYVLCCGNGCPACARDIRIQPKLFVPLFILSTSYPNGTTDRIQFWDRTLRFQPQLVNDVFRGYPNPSEYVFRITRHGVAGDVNTTYDIRAIQANTNPVTSYDGICSRFGVTFPDHFNTICKDLDVFQLESMMSATGTSNNGTNYGAVPRGNNSIPIPEGISDNSYTGMNIPGTGIPYTNQSIPEASIPNVPLNTVVPESAPTSETMSVSDSISIDKSENLSVSSEPVDPLETDEDIDTTNLNF